VLVPDETFAARSAAHISAAHAEDNAHGLGRELFGGMRKNVTSAEEGACTWL
jgi:phosphogluconate dehydratase